MKRLLPNSIVNEETLQQLVDGQLTGDRYREVVRELEGLKDGWRRCAIAFLQEQALAQELRSLSRSGFSLHSESAANKSFQTTSSVSVRPARINQNISRSAMWKTASKLNMLSLAASILVAFAVGWFGAGMRENESRLNGNNIGGQAESANMSTMAADQKRSIESSQPGLYTSNFDPTKFVFGSNDPFVPLDRQIPEQLLDLERRGLVQIETIDGLVPFELDDGRAAVIPVQNFRVRPVMVTY